MTEEELTKALIGKDFGVEGKGTPMFYKSEKTGKEYPYDEYSNHGQGGIYRGFLDLPIDEYPYLVIFGRRDYLDGKWVLVRDKI